MGRDTAISWTDATWNPIRGCSRVSEGCRNCYAEGVAYRFSGPGKPYEGLVRIGSDGKRRREWNGQVQFAEKHLLDPIGWKKPKRIFVNSMSDLFHEGVRIEWLESILQVVSDCPQHQFQVLTKRPERMRKIMSMLGAFHAGERMAICIGDGETPGRPYVLPNLHLGVSCENQATANERIPVLLHTPASVRFISAEPLLGPIELDGLRMLDWVIAGGESGPGARPMHPDWARSLRDQCQAAGVPYFFKQWGEYAPIEIVKAKFTAHIPAHIEFPDGTKAMKFGTKNAGATLDGREWHEFPAVPA